MYKINTLEDLPIFKDSPLFVDLETDGLYGPIVCAQFYQYEWDDVQIVLKPHPLQLCAILGQQHIVGHNLHYDISTIQAQARVNWQPKEFDDTFFLARLFFYTQEKFALDDVVSYAGFNLYQAYGIDKAQMQKQSWKSPLTKEQLTYAALDVRAAAKVFDVVKEAKDTASYKLDIFALKAALDFQCHGLPVDEERLSARFEQNRKRIAEIALPINANSYQQVRQYISSDESDGLGLAKLAIEGNERAAAVQETRKLIKENSFLAKFSGQSRIHGKFLPSARSGRFTSKDQNLQQLPRSTKSLFGVADDSTVLVFSDFSQLELRAVCAIVAEFSMEKLFREGKDLHSYTAEMLFGSDFTKQQRQIAKTANFNLLYGGGAAMLGSILIKSAGLIVPEDELQKIKTKWHKLWPKLTTWQQQGILNWRNGKANSTPFGRKYIANMMTDYLNIQVQGFGAEVAKLALHYMYPKLKERNARICNFVHDSYIVECKASDYKEVAHIVADSMKNAWLEASKFVRIQDLPMPVNVKVGTNWGDIENDCNIIYDYTI
jgi:DNA polymerase-1